jgi:hypothetical protein
MGFQDVVPVAEVWVGHSNGKPLYTDPVKGIFGITNIFAHFHTAVSFPSAKTLTLSL